MTAYMPADVVANLSNQRTDLKIARLDYYYDELAAQGRLTHIVKGAIANARAWRIDHRFIFYIAGALTGVDESTKYRYQLVSDLVGTYAEPHKRMFGYAPHLHSTDPVQHPHVTSAEVRDIDYIFSAIVPDMHLNFLYPIAHGNAVEAGWAEDAKIPSLYLLPADTTLSRLVRGMQNIAGTIEYTDFEQDGLPQLRIFLDQL